MNFPLPIFEPTRSAASRTDTTVSERTAILVVGTILAICIVGVLVGGPIFLYETFHAPSEAQLEQVCAAKGGSLRTIVGAKGHYTGCVVPLN